MTHRGRRRPRLAPLVWAALIALVGFALAGLTLVPLGRVGDGSAGTLVGDRAPTLDAPDLDRRRWTLDDANGRLVWINFWATWCPPCRIEMPMIQRLHERYGDRLLIVGVDFGEDRDTVADFVRRYDLTYPILLDPTSENFYRWSPQFGLPQHYFVDAEGRVLRQFNGELAPEEMLATVEELLVEVSAKIAPWPASSSKLWGASTTPGVPTPRSAPAAQHGRLPAHSRAQPRNKWQANRASVSVSGPSHSIGAEAWAVVEPDMRRRRRMSAPAVKPIAATVVLRSHFSSADAIAARLAPLRSAY